VLLAQYFAGNKMEKNKMGGACSACGGRGVACNGFWWENLKKRDHRGDPDVDGRIILRCVFKEWDVEAWTGSSWPRIGTGGGHL